MNSEENQILSDEDDLPDLFGDCNAASEQKFEISQHDIVWAEFRNLYWPALVRCVKKKERKASVWYLDSPKKCFKVPFKKIKSFSDPQITALIKDDVENSPMKAKHKRVWLNAVTFIRRKTQGYIDDPASFFDLSKHYLAYNDTEYDSHSLGKNSNLTLETKNYDTDLKTKNSDAASSDEESLVSDDEEENAISKKLSLFTNLDESQVDDPEVDNIVKCIAAGHVDKYLLQVKSKKVPSEYQEFYEDALKTNKGKLLQVTPTDHVKSTKKLKEIAIYLMNYYEKVVEGGKCEMVNYVMYVWVPEAIDKAVELIKKGSLDLKKAIPESRKQLFPTDKLVDVSIYNPIASTVHDNVTKAKGKKRIASKSCRRKQPKKVKELALDLENSLPAIALNKTEKRSLVENKIKPPVTSCDKKNSKKPVKSPTKSSNKRESSLPVRSSPRKKN